MAADDILLDKPSAEIAAQSIYSRSLQGQFSFALNARIPKISDSVNIADAHALETRSVNQWLANRLVEKRLQITKETLTLRIAEARRLDLLKQLKEGKHILQLMDYKPQITAAKSALKMIEPAVAPKVAPIVLRTAEPMVSAGRTITLAARANLLTTVIGIIIGVAAEKIAGARAKARIRQIAGQYKKIVRGSLVGLDQIFQGSLQDASNNVSVNATVDTSNFDAAIRSYMQNTKKDMVEVVNQKLYWIVLNAIKFTYKSETSGIRNALTQASDTMPHHTIAEAIVIGRASKQKKHLTKGEIKEQARKLINSRVRAVGFLRSGWIPAVRKLAKLQKKKPGLVAASKIKRGKDKGDASPAKHVSLTDSMKGGTIVGSAWNDIIADHNVKANNYMTKGLQAGMDKEAASMLKYVEDKLKKNADAFNRK